MGKRISQLTQLTAANIAQTDLIPIVDVSAGATKYATVKDLTGLPDVGWTSTAESWSYSSFNSTLGTGVITVPTDATTKYSKNMWVRFSQTTGGTKYGRIIAITSTTITVQFPSGTTLANEAITSPVYSVNEAPYGAPSADAFIYSYTNSGSAGGTMYFENNNGKKFLYGSTNSIGGTGVGINFPTGFFSAVRGIAADAHGGYTNTNVVYGHIETHNTSAMTVNNFATAGSSPSNPINVKVWGI